MITASERIHRVIGADPAIVKADHRTHHGDHTERHLDIAESLHAFHGVAFQVQVAVGAGTGAVGFLDAAHVGVEQMAGQRRGDGPGAADADQCVEMPEHRLIDPADVVGHVAQQGAAGQVIDHRAVQAQVEQCQSGGFKVGVAA